MKRLLLLFLCLMLMAGSIAPAQADTESHAVTPMEYPFYLDSADVQLSTPFPLYFFDGAADLPYVDMIDWCGFMNTFYHDMLGDQDYDLELTRSGAQATLIRENGLRMYLDCEKETLSFDDYNAFIHTSDDSSLLDMLSMSGFDSLGRPELFQRVTETVFDRHGRAITLPLNDYGIHPILNNGQYYVPLQTLNDFLLAPKGANILFNGQVLILMFGNGLGNMEEGYTALGELFYDGVRSARTPALAEYAYGELCLVLDHLYGLKENHDITSFDHLLSEFGYKEDLLNTQAQVADRALNHFIEYSLDDLHSAFNSFSCLTGKGPAEAALGLSSRKFNDSYTRFSEARAKAYPNGIPAYEEIGNTAYITIDLFDAGMGGEYYDAGADHPVDDTIGLIIYAHHQINRENSPIENVVIDLSNCLGGEVDAALYTISWFLGEAPFSVKDTFTGAQSTAIYQADINLDRQFDALDRLDGKKLFCLTSPVSFSCGNLVPAVFKSSQRVTLLGSTSGGGSCTILHLTTAHSTVLQISSPQRMSFLKNGSFYDIDQGIDPDVFINNAEHYYDRSALTDHINGIF